MSIFPLTLVTLSPFLFCSVLFSSPLFHCFLFVFSTFLFFTSVFKIYRCQKIRLNINKQKKQYVMSVRYCAHVDTVINVFFFVLYIHTSKGKEMELSHGILLVHRAGFHGLSTAQFFLVTSTTGLIFLG